MYDRRDEYLITQARVVLPGEVGAPARPCLLGGLRWALLPVQGWSPADVRQAMRQQDASRMVIASPPGLSGRARHQVAATLGMLTGELDPAVARTRDAHSAAAAAACWLANAGHSGGVLVLRTSQPDAPDARLVVYVANGLPQADWIARTGADARQLVESLAGEYAEPQARDIYADDPQLFPAGERVDWSHLLAQAGPATRIGRAPLPLASLAAVLGLLAVATGAYIAWDQYSARHARETQLLALRAADPTERYLAALQRDAASGAGLDADSLAQALRQLGTLPVLASGWRLSRVGCDAQGCTGTWTRVGGTQRDLQQLAAQTSQRLLPTATTERLDEARTSLSITLARAPLPSELPALSAANATLTPLLQRWATAGLQVRTEAASLWPKQTGVPASWRHPRAVHAVPVSVAGVPVALAAQLLAASPPMLRWERFDLVVQAAADARNTALLAFEGRAYVRP